MMTTATKKIVIAGDSMPDAGSMASTHSPVSRMKTVIIAGKQ
jgi:hypothetical protein